MTTEEKLQKLQFHVQVLIDAFIKEKDDHGSEYVRGNNDGTRFMAEKLQEILDSIKNEEEQK